jgi:hypothetical protein
MTVTINGTTGVTTPAVTNEGAYTGDGVVFANSTPSNTLVTTTDGRVGVGIANPSVKLDVRSNSGVAANFFGNDGNNYIQLSDNNGTNSASVGSISGGNFYAYTAGYSSFYTGGANERMRIDSSGNLLVGTTTAYGVTTVQQRGGTGVGSICSAYNHFHANTKYADFLWYGSSIGSITNSGGLAVAYNTSSDYRLKNTIIPMTGGLAKVALLKPCTYKWNADGSDGEGFIAHELAEVVPQAVTGEKDAVDAEGNPQYQGIDTSFLVATLTCAIQELKAELDTVKTELATLKGQA